MNITSNYGSLNIDYTQCVNLHSLSGRETMSSKENACVFEAARG